MSSNSTVDPRLLNLSYSGLLMAHTCPRKFQLAKQASISGEDSQSSKITFAYGHVVGLGIQNVLEGKTPERNLWEMFMAWDVDLWSDNPKQKKSFAGAVYAVQKFQALLEAGYLTDYELVYYEGKPACELSFLIHLPNSYKYRGFVDAVLRNKHTGEVIVLECKTSSATTVNPTTYKNSAQAIGYSIVLDVLFPELSSYRVIYLVYSTKTLQYESLDFAKSYVQRARWIRELIMDVEILSLYESHDLYHIHRTYKIHHA